MKTKKFLFLMAMFLFILTTLIVVMPNNAFATETMSDEFRQILNDEGKLVVTDTTMEENKQQFLEDYLRKYETDSYWFGVNIQYDETHYGIAMNDKITDNGEAHDVEVVFEEKISNEFKTILKDGKLQVPSSTKDGVNDVLQSYIPVLSQANANYGFELAGYNENYTKVTIKMHNNGQMVEQHVVELSYLTKQSEEFKKELNKDGKLVFNSIQPSNENEMRCLYELLFDVNNAEKGYYFSCPAEDYSSINLTINYGKVNQETHKVEIVYNYDKTIKQKLQGFVNNFPRDIEYFHVKDLELINYLVNNVENNGSENLDAYSGELKSAVNNSNIEYYVDNRAGEDSVFFTVRLGVAMFKYNDIIYRIDESLGTKAEHIIYVPDTTGNSKEELMAAAQKRINEYLGKDNIVTVSYAGNARDVSEAWIRNMYEATRSEWEEWAPNLSLEEWKEIYLSSPENVIGIDGISENDDTFMVTVKVGNKEKSLNVIIKKDSSKMITPSYKTADMTTNIEISSSSTSIPLDASIQAKQLTSGAEHDKIIKLLDVKENAMFDLKLYSSSLEKYVTKLEDGTFEVKIPVPDNLKDKKLVAYYTDGTGNPETYEVEVKDGYAIFKTKHFSIYTLAESKVDEDNKGDSNNSGTNDNNNNTVNTNNDNNSTDNSSNPKTGDNIIFFVGMLFVAVVGLIATIKFRKYNKK